MLIKLLSFVCTVATAACILCSCKSDKKVVDQTASFHHWIDSVFDAKIDRSPTRQTRYGIKKDYDKWDDLSDAHQDQEIKITQANLASMDQWDMSKLSDQAKITYDMYKLSLENTIERDKFRYHNYLAHQMRGVHDFIPNFLINFHKIDDVSDAQAYISRITNGHKFLTQAIEQMKIREDKGVIPPSFVFPLIMESTQNIIHGAPFTDDSDSAILNDFKVKISDLDLSDDEKNNLLGKLNQALTQQLLPGYLSMLDYLKSAEKKSTEEDGVWKFDQGSNYYLSQLRKMTTTDLTPDEIFEIGMSEIKRIHGEMDAIKNQVKFKGDLQAFFKFMRTDDQFYLPPTEQGRSKYIELTNQKVDRMRAKMDDLFHTKPKADLVVKPVEAYREKAAGKAFYNRPAPDGSRPGTYYANLYDMKQMPTYQMEALLHHEAIPGHHMQISINQELSGLPKFRRLGGNYTAYTEGWGLYAEYVPKELGFYEDPYSDFGRLAMELWRSCRLVVDVGIHHKKWSRQQGIDFYKNNTPNSEGDCIKMVNRHIVMPGQATAYKIGQIKILELRNKAERLLGDRYDIRDFHEVVLTNGAVPLDILEKLVDTYISDKLN